MYRKIWTTITRFTSISQKSLLSFADDLCLTLQIKGSIMIKTHSLITLVSLFVMNMPLMASKPKLGKRSATPPGLSTLVDTQDKKKAEEQPAALSAEKPANLAAAASPQASATPTAKPSQPVSPAPEVDQSKKPITLQAVIDRRKWGITGLLVPEAMRKGYHGSASLVMDALEHLTPEEAKAFKETNFESLEDQNLLGRAIEHLTKKDDTTTMAELIVLLKKTQVYAGPAHSKTIVDMLTKKQKDANDAFEQEYAKQCEALIALTRQHVERSDKLSELIDQTHQLGGQYNYTDTELRMKQGKFEGTPADVATLREKESRRKELGIVDNHSVHPEYVDPQTIIAVKSNALYKLESGKQSIPQPAVAK